MLRGSVSDEQQAASAVPTPQLSTILKPAIPEAACNVAVSPQPKLAFDGIDPRACAIRVVLSTYFQKCTVNDFYVGVDKGVVWSVLFQSLPETFMQNIQLVGKYIKKFLREWWKGVDIPRKAACQTGRRRNPSVNYDPFAKTLHYTTFPGIQMRESFVFDVNYLAQFEKCTHTQMPRLDHTTIQNGIEPSRQKAKNCSRTTSLDNPDNGSSEGGVVSNPQHNLASLKLRKISAKKRKSPCPTASSDDQVAFVEVIKGQPPFFRFEDTEQSLQISFCGLVTEAACNVQCSITAAGTGVLSGNFLVQNSEWVLNVRGANRRPFVLPRVVNGSAQSTTIAFHYALENNWRLVDYNLVPSIQMPCLPVYPTSIREITELTDINRNLKEETATKGAELQNMQVSHSSDLGVDVCANPTVSQSCVASLEASARNGQNNLSLSGIKDAMRVFTAERDWEQFHTPRNLLLALVGEVGELSEIFQWKGDVPAGIANFTEREKIHLGEELSDVLLYIVRLADKCHVDLSAAAIEHVSDKLKKNEAKYPAKIVKGSSKKYTEYNSN